MLSGQDDLDCSIVTDVHGCARRYRHVGETHGSRPGIVGGADELEGIDERDIHVQRPAVRTAGAKAEVDAEEGEGVTLKPAGLD